MNKRCGNCKYFDRYYVRGEVSYIRRDCGRCGKQKSIVELRGVCDQWKRLTYKRVMQRKYLTKVMNKMLGSLLAIQEVLKDEKEAPVNISVAQIIDTEQTLDKNGDNPNT